MASFFKFSSPDQQDIKTVKEKLGMCNIKTTPKLGLHGDYIARCLDVYDGDTCTLAVLLYPGDEEGVQIKCRMYGYDTPEIRGKAESPTEKVEGEKTRDVLSSLISWKYVFVKFSDVHEKWGRGITTIWICWNESVTHKIAEYTVPSTVDIDHIDATCMLNVNEWMEQNVLCAPYFGKTKTSFSDMCLLFEKKHGRKIEQVSSLERPKRGQAKKERQTTNPGGRKKRHLRDEEEEELKQTEPPEKKQHKPQTMCLIT